MYRIIVTAMRPAVRTPDAAAAAEHRHLSDISWHILGIATATEHSALTDSATATEHSRAMSGNIGSPNHTPSTMAGAETTRPATEQPDVTMALAVTTRSATEQPDVTASAGPAVTLAPPVNL